jgi:hypothetical protein
VRQKIAEMEALIEQTQAVKSWLVESLEQCECVDIGDCAEVRFEEDGKIQLIKR